jgi:hypothetical protein
MTMHKLTGGRFSLGLGRGIDRMFDAYGLPRLKTAAIEDFVGLMRRLWRGEVIQGHDGPAGSWPVLHLGAEFDEHIPMTYVAFGPNSLALGGRAFDAVVLHTFFTDETTQRCVRTVKEAAEKAGRDPDDVKVWSCFAAIGDHLPEPVRLRKLVGRMATYLQGYGDLMVKHQRLGSGGARALSRGPFPLVANFRGALDGLASDRSSSSTWPTLIPVGMARPCFGHGHAGAVRRPRCCTSSTWAATGVILHGATPT